MLNLAKLFRNEPDICFIKNLDLQKDDVELLRAARVDIRNALRDKLPAELEKLVGTKFEKPRFFTQGSWAYKTLNAPAQGDQQADLDDGCYLPLSDIQETKKPSTAAKKFFEAVENILGPLAESHGWKLVTDKATCSRMVISEKAHIDIPLYAIVDSEFEKLKKAESMAMDSRQVVAKYDSWDQLPKVKVLLAHRDDDWIDSDPRQIADWFEDQCKQKGGQLRHIVRYLKGFRDQKWEIGGPSSILIMSAVAPIFQKYEGRDDLALEAILRELPRKLRGVIKNPTNDNEILTNRVSKDDLEKFATAFEELNAQVSAAIAENNSNLGCSILRNEFGHRLPHRPDLVTVVTPQETIKSTPAIITSSSLIGKTQAGSK